MEVQVRRRFGSSVHFSPSLGSKEFFLVVSFSSASFPLNEESVGLALQSCIGGIAEGFIVYQLTDRRFRFSLASNRVGHFIYGLRDRIWPDFICHFSLFRSVDPTLSGFFHLKTLITPSQEILDLSQRDFTHVRPHLEVLAESAHLDHSADHEVAKFGFARPVHSPTDHPITFGSFTPVELVAIP